MSDELERLRAEAREAIVECPHCGAEVKGGGWGEVEHMEAQHPEIIVQRLTDAGMRAEAEAFEQRRKNPPKDYAGIFEDVAGVLDRHDPDEMTMMAEAMRIHARQEREFRASLSEAGKVFYDATNW